MKNTVKRIFAGLLTFALTATLFVGCSKKNDSGSNQEAKKKIGISQLVDHTSLNEIRENIISELDAQGYGDKVDVEYQNCQGDISNTNTVAQKFVGDKKDLIVAITTQTAQAAKNATKTIPIVFAGVSDPVGAKLVDSLEKPTQNVTGTSNTIPVEKIFELAKELNPDAKVFGSVYNQSEQNASFIMEKAKQYAAENGYTIIEAPITNEGDVQSAAQSLVGKIDAYFIPNDNTVASCMKVLSSVAINAKLPVYTTADSMIVDGGLATYGLNYAIMGKQTAQMVIDILFKGKNPTDMPVQGMKNFSVVINQTTAEKIGVKIPDSIMSSAKIVK